MGMGGFQTIAQRSYDWYESHCENGNEAFGNQIHCNVNLIFSVGMYFAAGIAAYNTGVLINNIIKGKAPLFQEEKK